MTDDSYTMEDTEDMTCREFTNTFLKYREKDSVELKLAYYVGIDVDSEEMKLLEWLGLFDDTRIGLEDKSPAQILQHILEKKWTMSPDDKDMIVMWHLFSFHDGKEEREITSSMVVLGENQHETAMAKTVGLPIGIAAKKILNGDIKLSGVHIPTLKEIYSPILIELGKHGINFKEEERSAKASA
jgi:saccharopine dehydrogenase (NADP+, L-glutamate forming)